MRQESYSLEATIPWAASEARLVSSEIAAYDGCAVRTYAYLRTPYHSGRCRSRPSAAHRDLASC
eukprot:6175623-Pleurochrysis_carterae.AAC.1